MFRLLYIFYENENLHLTIKYLLKKRFRGKKNEFDDNKILCIFTMQIERCWVLRSTNELAIESLHI